MTARIDWVIKTIKALSVSELTELSRRLQSPGPDIRKPVRPRRGPPGKKGGAQAVPEQEKKKEIITAIGRDIGSGRGRK